MVISEAVLFDQETERPQKNAEYFAMLDKADQDLCAGRVIVFENDDWMFLSPDQLRAVADEQRRHWDK